MSVRSVKNVFVYKINRIRLFAACGHNKLGPYERGFEMFASK